MAVVTATPPAPPLPPAPPAPPRRQPPRRKADGWQLTKAERAAGEAAAAEKHRKYPWLEQAAKDLVTRTCAAQGIPEKVTDPVILGKVAAILARALEDQRGVAAAKRRRL